MGYQSEKALEVLTEASKDGYYEEERVRILQLAQVHATLALAECISSVGNRLIEVLQNRSVE
jgi:hypothetical protein